MYTITDAFRMTTHSNSCMNEYARANTIEHSSSSSNSGITIRMYACDARRTTNDVNCVQRINEERRASEQQAKNTQRILINQLDWSDSMHGATNTEYVYHHSHECFVDVPYTFNMVDESEESDWANERAREVVEGEPGPLAYVLPMTLAFISTTCHIYGSHTKCSLIILYLCRPNDCHWRNAPTHSHTLSSNISQWAYGFASSPTAMHSCVCVCMFFNFVWWENLFFV